MKHLPENQGLSRKQRRLLNLALRVASDSENRHQHGAVLVKSGKVMAVAPNVRRNDPLLANAIFPDDPEMGQQFAKEECSEHAEARVVRLVGDKAAGSIVYVARINNSGEPLLSKPCSACENLLVANGVKAVVYSC